MERKPFPTLNTSTVSRGTCLRLQRFKNTGYLFRLAEDKHVIPNLEEPTHGFWWSHVIPGAAALSKWDSQPSLSKTRMKQGPASLPGIQFHSATVFLRITVCFLVPSSLPVGRAAFRWQAFPSRSGALPQWLSNHLDVLVACPHLQ